MILCRCVYVCVILYVCAYVYCQYRNNKLTEERRDIDMLLASSVSNTQNPWVSSHADPVSDGR